MQKLDKVSGLTTFLTLSLPTFVFDNLLNLEKYRFTILISILVYIAEAVVLSNLTAQILESKVLGFEKGFATGLPVQVFMKAVRISLWMPSSSTYKLLFLLTGKTTGQSGYLTLRERI